MQSSQNLIDDSVLAQDVDPGKRPDHGVGQHRKQRNGHQNPTPFFRNTGDKIRRRNSQDHADQRADQGDPQGPDKDFDVIRILEKGKIAA